MKLVVFGLTVSSSWGNGHATLWRGLIRALAARGHEVTFFERDVPYYAAHRDLDSIPGGRLILYAHWSEVAGEARRRLADADVAIVTSYCPDAIRAAQAVFDHARRAISVFYDLDTPVSLARIRAGESVPYVPRDGLGDFDLVLSFTGGAALEALREHLGAKRVSPLYGHVDPALHRPCAPVAQFCADLSYLGTYAADRQDALEALFIEPARRRPDLRFVLGGSAYPPDFPWRENIWYVSHVAPADHAAFFSSSRVTLNVTRRDMAALGFCPSGRLFEAAACGSPLMSDAWPGIEDFFTPGTEILVVSNSEEATAALELSDAELGRIARAARERTLEEHTSSRRADELILRLEETRSARPTRTCRTCEANRNRHTRTREMWGVIPAAGNGSRIQPLAFSKELLPVGAREDERGERPRAVSEYLLERLIAGGADKVCFVISPGKFDILQYFGGRVGSADIAYVVQPRAAGLCDAVFRAAPLVHPGEPVAIGLPDTIWFPEDALARLPPDRLAFLLFPSDRPELFDAVILDEDDAVAEIQVKSVGARSRWIWGAIRMPGSVFHELHALWRSREERDQYIGTLVNAWLRGGGRAVGVRAGESYVDVGTLHGYREAIQLLASKGRRAAGSS